MKPTSLEYKQLREMDQRLIRFKEAKFTELCHPDPRGMFILVLVFCIPIVGPILLILGLLHEWFTKFFRMCWIVVKAGYFYSMLAIRKSIERFETKLFDIWRKMI